jgi:hypothetical protein
MAEKKDKQKKLPIKNLDEISGGKVNLNDLIGLAGHAYDVYNQNRQSAATSDHKKQWYRDARIDYKYQQFGHDQYTDLENGRKLSADQAKALVYQRTGKTPDWN